MFRHSSMLQNTLLLSAANLAMRGVSMAFQIYLTGQIGAVGIGLMQLLLTVNCFAITVGTSGIRVAAMYFSAEEYGRGSPQGIRQSMVWCTGVGAVLSALTGAAMVLGAEGLALAWVKELRAAPALRLMGLTLPLTCLSTILSGYFTACGKIRQLAAVEIADRIASIGFTVWLLGKGSPADLSHACASIVGGSALAALGSVAILLGLMLWDFRVLPPGRQPEMGRRLWRFCLPVALNDYLRSGLGTLEQFLIPYGLSRCGGSRDLALADYGIIHGMVFPALLLPNTILFAAADLLIPRLARCRAQADRPRLRALVSRCLHACILFACAAAGLFFVLAEPLGLLLYKSSAAGQYLRLFAPLIPILYMDCIVDGMHKGLGQQSYCVRVNTLTNLLDVILLFLLLPKYGIGGYFFTYTVTHIINFYLSLKRLLAVTDVDPKPRFLLQAAGSLCAAAAAAKLIPAGSSWSALLLQGGIYLVVFTLLWASLVDKKHTPG